MDNEYHDIADLIHGVSPFRAQTTAEGTVDPTEHGQSLLPHCDHESLTAATATVSAFLYNRVRRETFSPSLP